MNYALSIDWLSFFCTSQNGEIDLSCDVYTYEKQERGTRSFAELIHVSHCGELLCYVQQKPYSGIMAPRSMIVKFDNRRLYEAGLWTRIERFFMLHNIVVQNISRCDLCTDFNCFAGGLHPKTLIRQFLNSELRHIGRGIGNAHFNHGANREGKVSKSFVNYTGLSFGSNESDARIYLYDKTFELYTVKDKPYIKDLWRRAGLTNTEKCHVWRLEVSIKSKGMQFKDKDTKQPYKIDMQKLSDNASVSSIYFAFVKSLWQFVKNREGITNISREPRIEFFNGEPYINRGCLPALSGGNRAERILIKSLWQMSHKYRGTDIIEDEGICKLLAQDLAKSTNLTDWLQKKSGTWKEPLKS